MIDKRNTSVGIVAKPQPEGRLPLLDELVAWLSERDVSFILDPEAARLTEAEGRVLDRMSLPSAVDLVVVLGGDGTLLSVARHCGSYPVPILGVNLGHLGFLTEISAGEMFPVLESCLNGSASIEGRMMLDATLIRHDSVVAGFKCLNDVVFNKAALARMIEIRVEVGNILLTKMRADGLIVSTPTGSTAYNLSAGGPILTPGMDGVIITPLCPHTLTMRPLIVDGRAPVTITLTKESGEVFLTADGQSGHPVEMGDRVRIEKSSDVVRLVTSKERNYFALLREKLGWGTQYP